MVKELSGMEKEVMEFLKGREHRTHDELAMRFPVKEELVAVINSLSSKVKQH